MTDTPSNNVGEPTADLARVRAAHLVFIAAISGLDDDAMRADSRLPGWSVGHLLTHIARNADSHIRRVEGARRGEVVNQYPGGVEGRSAEVDAGASRPAATDEFVALHLPTLRETSSGRLPAGAKAPGPGVLSEREELAWLYGRYSRPDLPVLAPWG